ncbi:unnamed protein product, partial [marine sediment metagenome]
MGNSILPLGGGDTRRINETIIQAAHGFVAGQVVRHDGTTFVLAQANSAVNAEGVGVIESATVNDFEVVYQGRIDISGWLSSVPGYPFPPASAGEDTVLFLAATAPGVLPNLTATPATGLGEVVKAMLITADGNDGIVTGYVGVLIGGENTVTLGEIQPVGEGRIQA